MISNDTIAAISSSVGPAARMIVRLSGPNAFPIAAVLSSIGRGGQAIKTTLHFHDLHIPVWLYFFNSRHSYTTDDLVEFHIPGNPLLARMILDELLKLGARAAEPGEFTARAFFHGRLDLTAAEGVAATIAAHNQQELSAARQLLSGELARRLTPLMDRLAQMLALVEVGIDFAEEDVTFISAEQVNNDIDDIKRELQNLYQESPRFERLTHEPSFVLVGRPNAGKSTLLNALAGGPRAIVSEAAGTTRDALSAEVALDRGIIRLIDVAGLEETSPTEPIPQQMHQRALRTLHEADFVILIHDITDPRPLLKLPRDPDLVIHSKSDLLERASSPSPPYSGEKVGLGEFSRESDSSVAQRSLSLSAQTNQNLDILRQKLSYLAFGSPTSASAALALNSRHLQAIDDTLTSLNRAQDALQTMGDEVIAMELRESLHSLGQILGQLTPDDLLGRIFSTFCIGK